MKKKYKLEKKKRGYVISSINNKEIRVATHILAGKVMQKCRMDEVPASVVALVEQCTKGVQFNCSKFLCKYFLENCREAQEQGKTFHYAWLLLSIVLVAGELPEDSQFPTNARDLPEAAKYASMWATTDTHGIQDSKIFWVSMEMNIIMGINRKPWLSPTIYNILESFTEFKAEFHHIYLRVCKDPAKKWNELPYMATDDVIFDVLETWLPEWCAPDISTMEMSVKQKKKEEAKLCMAQLAEKRRKEAVVAKAQEARDAAQTTTKGHSRSTEGCRNRARESEVAFALAGARDGNRGRGGRHRPIDSIDTIEVPAPVRADGVTKEGKSI